MNWKQRTIEVANQYGIDPAIAVAQIQQESSFNPNARSGQGAMGLAQFIPGTWAQYGSGDPFDGEASLQAWAKYMTHLLNVFGGDYRLALAGYHSGEGAARGALRNPAGNPRTNEYVNKIMSNAGGTPHSFSSPDSSGESSLIIPLVIAAVVLYFIL